MNIDNFFEEICKQSVLKQWDEVNADEYSISKETEDKILALIESYPLEIKEKEHDTKRAVFRKRRLSFPRVIAAAIVSALLISLATMSSLAGDYDNGEFLQNRDIAGMTLNNYLPEEDKNELASQIISEKQCITFPSGYTQQYSLIEDYLVDIIYSNGDDTLEFCQMLFSTNELITDTNCELEYFKDGSTRYVFYSLDSTNTLKWNSDKYSFLLASQKLSKDELVTLSKTLAPLNSKEEG